MSQRSSSGTRRTSLSRSCSAAESLVALESAVALRRPRSSLSDVGRTASHPLPSARRMTRSDDAEPAVGPLPSARQKSAVRGGVPSLALGKRAGVPSGNAEVALPSARGAAGVGRNVGAVRQSQGSLAQPLPSARRGTRDAAGVQSEAKAPLASARRGTKDVLSSVPLPSARRGTKDSAALPLSTPRQSSDFGSKAGGRWM